MKRPIHKLIVLENMTAELLADPMGLKHAKQFAREEMRYELEKMGRVLVRPIRYEVSMDERFDQNDMILRLIAFCVYVGRRRCKSTKVKHQMREGE